MSANASTLRVVGRKDYTTVDVVGKSVPISFGGNFTDDPITRKNLRKSHTLGAAGLQAIAPLPDSDLLQPRSDYNTDAAKAYQWQTTTSQLHPPPLGATLSSTSAGTLPSADATPDPFRFLGYIRESVPESQVETFRIRKVGVFFYPRDATIAVREASSINSGIDQGTLLKRQPVPRDIRDPTGGNVQLDDFSVGRFVDIYAFRVYILDMDEASRRYFANVLKRSPAEYTPLAYPSEEDVHTQKVQQSMSRSGRRMLPTADYDYKRALESMTGAGGITKHAPQDVRSAQQFLRNSINEHLSFDALWDDRKRMSGDLRLVVIRYYLENDAVEIVEKRPENCGREGGAKLLCRQRVPIPGVPIPSSHVGGMIQQNTYGLLFKQDHVTEKDFLPIGKYLRLYEHDYLIYDADAFTRQWYQREKGIQLGAPVDVTEILNRGVKPLPVQYPPPHIGFGTEEDSVQSWKHLVMKTVKVDTDKLLRESGKSMVFRAVFSPDQPLAPQDEGREFVIRFHRASDEIEVFEKQIRNSGIVGGKFLARGRHLKPMPDGRKLPFTPDDFVVGRDVTIVGHTFRLLELDELSRKQCEGITSAVSEDRIKTLIVALKDLLNSKYCRLHEAFRAVAPDGLLTVRQLRDFFDKCSGPISEEEAMGILYHFSGDQGGATFQQFINMMAFKNTGSMDETSNNARALKLSALPQRGSAEHANAVHRMRLSDEATRYQRLRKMLIDKLEVRRAYLLEVFRLLSGAAPNARLTAAAFKENLKEQLQINVGNADKDVLVSMLFTTEEDATRGIQFNKFYEFVDPTIVN